MQLIPQLSYTFDSAERLARHITQIDSQLILWCPVSAQPHHDVRISILLPDHLPPFVGKLVRSAHLIGINGIHFAGFMINEQHAILRMRCLALIQPHRQLCGTILARLF